MATFDHGLFANWPSTAINIYPIALNISTDETLSKFAQVSKMFGKFGHADCIPGESEFIATKCVHCVGENSRSVCLVIALSQSEIRVKCEETSL